MFISLLFEDSDVYNMVNINNELLFPGIAANISSLRSWEWIYGKSPKFTLNTPNNTFFIDRGKIQAVDGPKKNFIGLTLVDDLSSLYH